MLNSIDIKNYIIQQINKVLTSDINKLSIIQSILLLENNLDMYETVIKLFKDCELQNVNLICENELYKLDIQIQQLINKIKNYCLKK